MRVICDIETNRLENPDRIWCIVCKDIDNEEVTVFTEEEIRRGKFRSFASRVSLWIGHNFVQFDSRVINSLVEGVHINPLSVLDSLLLSRLFRYDVSGGHSLDAWGQRLGFPKVAIKNFSEFSPEIIDRCIADVEINFRLYKKFEPYLDAPQYRDAIKLEHQILAVCQEMNRVGFAFNKAEAEKMYEEVCDRLGRLQSDIIREFPPKKVLVREFIASTTKEGKLHRGQFRWYDGDPSERYSPGDLVQVWETVPFDPASPKQRIDRLWDAGWQPVDKTKTHLHTERSLRYCKDKSERERLEKKLEHFRVYGWKLNEENLSTLPSSAPLGARALAQWITLDSRRSTLEEWLKAVQPDGRIHGTFNPIGAWTHRMSHQAPNQANIPSHPDIKDPENPSPVEQIKTEYNLPMRALWTVEKGNMLVGTDATSIQLRLLAHFMGDEEYISALLGNKDDVHGLNAIKLGIWPGGPELPPEIKYRAKRYIYAWLLGAGIDKVMEILNFHRERAKQAVDDFVNSMPGLVALKEQQKEDYNRGYFIGLDGRYVPVPSGAPHKVMSGYLQNGEVVVMKRARIIWGTQLKREKIWFKPVDFVHDEWQTEVRDDMELAEYIGKVQQAAIRRAGEELGLRIRLDGDSKYGYTWRETH